jgi:hypothetical protein
MGDPGPVERGYSPSGREPGPREPAGRQNRLETRQNPDSGVPSVSGPEFHRGVGRARVGTLLAAPSLWAPWGSACRRAPTARSLSVASDRAL